MQTTATAPLMSMPNRSSLRRDVIAGALSGQVAGLIMALAMVAVFALILGKSPAFPVQVIGSFVYGDAALVGFHAPAFFTGLVLHQAGPSLLWGLAFGFLVNKLQPPQGLALVGLGLTLGIGSELLDVGVLVPAFMNMRFGHNLWAENVPRLWDWTAHLVFGLSLGVFPLIHARLGKIRG